MSGNAPLGTTTKPVVLIVDDEPVCRAAAAVRLEMLGAEVVEAEDGAAAMALLRTQPFHAAIIDLEMPKIDGFQLIGCIRGHPKLKHMPIVVLSGRDDRASIQMALGAGATSYLLKPLNWSAFNAHLQAIIDLHRPTLPTALHA